ncbi:hypothetical protein GW796_06250 [archaeon]|nr:hypothetical protein [archaeon]
MIEIIGKCNVIFDSKGNDYLALDISPSNFLPYESFMINHGFNHEVNLKKERDNGKYHITLINVAQWGFLIKKGETDSILKQYNNQLFKLTPYGIGKAEKNGNTAYFLIFENDLLNNIRINSNLEQHDFHMTLGFKDKDVFGKPKNRSTCIFSQLDIINYINKTINPKKIKP